LSVVVVLAQLDAFSSVLIRGEKRGCVQSLRLWTRSRGIHLVIRPTQRHCMQILRLDRASYLLALFYLIIVQLRPSHGDRSPHKRAGVRPVSGCQPGSARWKIVLDGTCPGGVRYNACGCRGLRLRFIKN